MICFTYVGYLKCKRETHILNIRCYFRILCILRKHWMDEWQFRWAFLEQCLYNLLIGYAQFTLSTQEILGIIQIQSALFLMKKQTLANVSSYVVPLFSVASWCHILQTNVIPEIFFKCISWNKNVPIWIKMRKTCILGSKLTIRLH